MAKITFVLFCALCVTVPALKFINSKPKDSSMIQDLASTDIHRTFLQQQEKVFIAQKTFESSFKLGREGSNRCLAFLHIPKNAGTSLEDHWERVAVVKAQDSTVRHWGRHDTSLNCSHPVYDKECAFKYMKDGKEKTSVCYRWHVPPMYDEKLAASYNSDGCEIACVVRSPSDRFFSEIVMTRKDLRNNCTLHNFRKEAHTSIQETEADPYWHNCHMVPQTDFIYGRSKEPQYCKHILRHENLRHDFQHLVKDFDIPVELVYFEENPDMPGGGNGGEETEWYERKYTALNDKQHEEKLRSLKVKSTVKRNKCKIPLEVRDKEQEVHDFIMTHYEADLRNFNYTL